MKKLGSLLDGLKGMLPAARSSGWWRVDGLDAQGQEVRLKLAASDAEQARAAAVRQGLWVTRLTPAHGEGALLARRPARLGQRQVTRYVRQLASLLQSGLTVEQALVVLADDDEDAQTRQQAAAMREAIRGGATLAQAFAGHSHGQPGGARFPALCRAVIHAGELSGRLPQVMDKLAEHFEARGATESKVLAALVYPAVVAVVSLLIVSGLMLWVVPQMVGVFAQRGVLPLPTRILMAVSGGLRDWGVPLLAGSLLAGVLAAASVRRSRELALRWSAALLRLPLFGRLLRLSDTARFASTLAILTRSGVGILTALEAAGDVIANRYLQAGIRKVTQDVQGGVLLSRALAASRLFPAVLIHMVRSGEATGELPAMLERSSQQMNRELEERVNVLTSLLGPALVLVMGLLVLFIVLAILMPVFEINEMVR
ncbi:type II secretion system F family protein [Chitinilyticum litopenaei]|uniref:type II secretion system F family protein n=1 Tax=Chitinilyticum litopenaei TaxID=1121276 RepID=UPI00042710CE|nr:type II secretion system F family protein [Chitinilyticum litopenaei]